MGMIKTLKFPETLVDMESTIVENVVMVLAKEAVDDLGLNVGRGWGQASLKKCWEQMGLYALLQNDTKENIVKIRCRCWKVS